MRRGETPDPQRLDDGLSAIDTMSTRVAFLLDDVVDMARDRGQQAVPFEPEPTDLVALARRCAGRSGPPLAVTCRLRQRQRRSWVSGMPEVSSG